MYILPLSLWKNLTTNVDCNILYRSSKFAMTATADWWDLNSTVEEYHSKKDLVVITIGDSQNTELILNESGIANLIMKMEQYI